MNIKSKIQTIPDYPKPGIMFRDITTLIKDPQGLKMCIDDFVKKYKNKNIDLIVGIESRGFIIGSALAFALNKGFVPVRKKGKLPSKTIKQKYTLEYGIDILEIHKDAITKNQKVLIIDDLLATGGTATAAAKLVQKLKGKVIEAAFIIELPELKGGEKLKKLGIPYYAQVSFDGE